jgi:microcystin-dependent protein
MDGYIAEIRLFGGNFAPQNWAFCQGQILSINQNTALYSLLGTTYGGNGQTTFALPNLAGRVVVGTGSGPGLSNRMLGEIAGTENVTGRNGSTG